MRTAASKGGEEAVTVRPARTSDGDIFGSAPADGKDEGHSKWGAQADAIVEDMRAHLGRRKLRENADLITARRGPLGAVISAIQGILQSRYLRNLRRSALLAIGMWSWYVFNTKTYVRPEYED